MHRLILNPPPDLLVDHINRNGLDNRKANLRLATKAQNRCNTKKTKNAKSKYRGLYLKTNKKFGAQIVANGKKRHLGYFDSEIEAAKAYDKAAKKHHGQFASLNFP